MKGRSVCAIAAATAAVLVSGIAAASASAGLPVIYNLPVGLTVGTVNVGGSPPGANNWSCRPSAAHPRPVVLVHGTFGNMANSWNALSPLLKNNGYCVFALNYGGGDLIAGTGPVAASAAELAAFVDRVRTATGAGQVDIVGHSQGGMMPRYYLKFLGGAPKVHTLVGLAPSNHGGTVSGFANLAAVIPGATGAVGALCGACNEQVTGSSFLANLNAGGDTVPGVSYTVIETIYDELVTPYTSAFLSGPGVKNITLQHQCVLDGVDHLAIIYDHIALRDVLNALDPAHARGTLCTPILPLVGG
jgi:triacylglycerol esterase/lipase EstA (alpha/beta hydrolase family)